jgi:hypothetical protein
MVPLLYHPIRPPHHRRAIDDQRDGEEVIAEFHDVIGRALANRLGDLRCGSLGQA